MSRPSVGPRRTPPSARRSDSSAPAGSSSPSGSGAKAGSASSAQGTGSKGTGSKGSGVNGSRAGGAGSKAARAGSGGSTGSGVSVGGTSSPAAGSTRGAVGAGPDRSDAADGSAAETAPPTVFLAASYILGVFLGVGLGLYGVFLVPDGPRPGGTLISVGLFLALLGNTAAALLVRWLTGTRLGAVTVLIGWAPTVLLFASTRPEGDLLLRSSGSGYGFLVLGLLAPVVVATVGRTRRGLTALPPPR